MAMRNAFLLALILAAAPSAVRAEEPKAKGGPDAVNPRIAVEGRINGQPVRWCVDTGCTYTTLLRHAAERLKLKVTEESRTRAGGLKVFLSEKCDVVLGSGTPQQAVLEVADAPLFRDVDGLIGWQDILRNIVIVIDPDTLACSTVPGLPEEAKRWATWPIAKDPSVSNVLAVEIGPPDGPKAYAVLDTGDPGNVYLNPKRWDQWISLHRTETSTLVGRVSPVDGVRVGQECWAGEISLGPIRIEGTLIDEMKSSADEYFEAALGLGALRRFNLVIDGPHGVIYYQPRKTSAQPCNYNRLAAVFMPKDLQSDPLLAHVVENGPAWRAGVRPGDELLKIVDLDTTQWRTDPKVLPLARFWEQPAGTELHLTLRRDGKPFDVNVTLEEIFPESVKRNPPVK